MSARVWCRCRDCDLVFSRGPTCEGIESKHPVGALEVCTGCIGGNGVSLPPERHAPWCPVRDG